MKLLIALALFAVAYGEQVQVVTLDQAPIPSYAKPDIRPLIVPQRVLDAIKSYQPVRRDAPIDDESMKVRVVDAPLEVPAEPVAAAEDLKVHFVDAPLDVAEERVVPEPVRLAEPSLPEYNVAAPEAVRIAVPSLPEYNIAAPDAVRIAEAPLPDVEYNNVAPEPVRLAEAPLPVVEYASAPEAVKIAEAAVLVIEPVMIAVPLIAELPAFEGAEAAEVIVPEPVRLPQAPMPVVEEANIDAPEAVRVAVPRFPGKQFADPRLR